MKPRVSCVMITARRRDYVPRAIRYFQEQTYPNRELVIYDNGETPIGELVPRDRSIRYYRRHFEGDRSIGQLRNTANDVTNGDLIAHWDDDDYSAPKRLEDQVELLRDFNIGGYHSMLFWDESDIDARLWKMVQAKGTAFGTSLIYRRSFWRENQFPNTSDGEDNAFQLMDPGRVITGDAIVPLRMIARMHQGSTMREIHRTLRRRHELEPGSVGGFSAISHKPTIEQVRELLK